VATFGVQSGSVLELSMDDDPIIIVDVKFGTVFGLLREEAIELGFITPGNPYKFMEAVGNHSLSVEKHKSPSRCSNQRLGSEAADCSW
jgi:hypothetical protein